jgi:hypothetical protein
MKNISLQATILTYNNTKSKIKKSSLAHSLRFDIENINQNFDSSKSKNNFIMIDGILKKQNDFSQEDLKNVFLNLTNETAKTTMTKSDIKMKSKSISYIKKYFNNEEFNKIFDKYISEYNEDSKKELNNYIENYKNNNEKIKKSLFNNLDKLENIMQKYGAIKNSQENNQINMIEFILKIPHKNEVDEKEISSNDLLINSKDFFKKYFPDYKLEIAFSHNDELHKNDNGIVEGQHCHLFINTKNNKTNKLDFYKQQQKVLKEFIKNDYKILEKYMNKEEYKLFQNMSIEEKDLKIDYLLGKDNIKQTYKQTRNMGKILQELIYDFTNKNLLNKKNLNAVVYKNIRTKEQKREINLDSKKKTTERIYNGYNLVKEKKEKIEKTLNIFNDFLYYRETKDYDFTKENDLIRWYEDKKEEIVNNVQVEYKNTFNKLNNDLNEKKSNILLLENDINNKINELEKLKAELYKEKTKKKSSSKNLEQNLEKIIDRNIEEAKTFMSIDKDILKIKMLKSFKHISNFNFLVDEESNIINKYKNINIDKNIEIEELKKDNKELKEQTKTLNKTIKKIEELEENNNKLKEDNNILKIDLHYLNLRIEKYEENENKNISIDKYNNLKNNYNNIKNDYNDIKIDLDLSNKYIKKLKNKLEEFDKININEIKKIIEFLPVEFEELKLKTKDIEFKQLENLEKEIERMQAQEEELEKDNSNHISFNR